MDEITKIAAEAESKNQVVEEVAPKEAGDKFDSLSKSDALKEAINHHRQAKEETQETKVSEAPTKKEVTAAVQADPEPPAEFSREGKEAWKNKDIAGIQKEFRRVHDARTQEISRAQTEARQAKEEGKTYRELAKMAAPYIEARGAEGVTPEKAIMEALALIQEFKKGDPATVKSELKKIGIDLDAAPGTSTAVPKELEQKIASLQTFQEEYVKERETEKFNKVVQTFETAFQALSSQKNRTGEPLFPDLLDTSEKGKERARRIGSRTQDKFFIEDVLAEFPDADFTVIVREAYKAERGRVSGQPVQVSQSNQQHIEKSRRAAASTPGRIVTRNGNSNLIGKLDKSAAIRQAIRDRREQQQH